MDYKLEALHKSYQSRIVAWIVSFIAGFTIAAALIITAAFLKSDVIAIIGGSLLLILIVAYAIMCFTNCTTPEWLEKAEQEYQFELLKIATAKEAEEEAFRIKLKKVTGEDVSYLESDDIRYLIKNFGYIVDLLEKMQTKIDEETKKAKKSALDKKLGSKAKK